jgi:hypothetical protein
MTYDIALSLFRNMVNQKHPPQMGVTKNRTRRHFNETTAGRGLGRGGYGRGGQTGNCSGRGNYRSTPRQSRNVSRMITLTDGNQIE